MRRAFLAVLLLCAATVGAQDYIRYYPPNLSVLTNSGTTLTTSVPILFPNGSASAPAIAFANYTTDGWYRNSASGGIWTVLGGSNYYLFQTTGFSILRDAVPFYMGASQDVAINRDAADTLALRRSTNAQTLHVYNSFTTAGSNYGRFSISATATGTDLIGNGAGATAATGAFRSLQGSLSKTLTDNTATAFVRLTVADDDYEGCSFGWTAYAEDADTDARQIRKGRNNVAILNNGGTEACNFSASTDDEAVLVTAGTFTCTFDCAAGTNTVDLRATCDTSLDAAAETLTFEYRLDCESVITTLTPQ